MQDLWRLQTGLTYMGLKRWTEALAELKRVVRTSPHYGDAVFAQALCEHNRGNQQFATNLLGTLPENGSDALANSAQAFRRIIDKSQPAPRLKTDR
jgi:hypothetical protein